MANFIEAAVSTGVDVPALDSKSHGAPKIAESSEEPTATAPKGKTRSKYRHIAAYHSVSRTSCLSRDTTWNPSFIGFRNLMVIVLSELTRLDGFGKALLLMNLLLQLS